jgi:hypothetical protein
MSVVNLLFVAILLLTFNRFAVVVSNKVFPLSQHITITYIASNISGDRMIVYCSYRDLSTCCLKCLSTIFVPFLLILVHAINFYTRVSKRQHKLNITSRAFSLANLFCKEFLSTFFSIVTR